MLDARSELDWAGGQRNGLARQLRAGYPLRVGEITQEGMLKVGERGGRGAIAPQNADGYAASGLRRGAGADDLAGIRVGHGR